MGLSTLIVLSSNVLPICASTLNDTYLVYGNGETHKKELQDDLTKDINVNNLHKTNINKQDMYSILGIPDISNNQIDSTVLLVPAKKNTGIHVNIIDFNKKNNITNFTSEQYAMCACLLGLNDVTINISSSKKTTGISVLAAIVKAMKENNITVSQASVTKIENLLLATQNTIIQNKNNAQIASKLSAAILSTLNNASHRNISNSQLLNKLFNDELHEYKINKYVKNTDKIKIEKALLMIYQDKNIMNKDTLTYLQNNITILNKSVGEIMTQQATAKNTKTSSSILDTIKFYLINIKNKLMSCFGHAKLVNNSVSQQKLDIPDNVKPLRLPLNNFNYNSGSSNSSLLLDNFSMNSILENINEGISKFSSNELNMSYNNNIDISNADNLGRMQTINMIVTPKNVNQLLLFNHNINNSNINPSGYTDYEKANYVFKGKQSQLGWHSNVKNNNLIKDCFTNNINRNAMIAVSSDTFNEQNKVFKHIGDVVKKGNSVKLQIVPIYNNDELIPRELHIQAISLNDDGTAININCILNNIQNNNKLNYQ